MNSEQIKVLMIGMDRNLFQEKSTVRARICNFYGPVVNELHIVIFSLQSHGFKVTQIAPNVWLYPTNSWSRWIYPIDAVRIGRKIVRERGMVPGRALITTQDPFECGWAGMTIQRQTGISLEVQMHIDPLFTEGIDKPLDIIRKVISKRVINAANSIRVVADFIKERVEKKFDLKGKNIYTLPVYIDRIDQKDATAHFNLHERYQKKNVILSVARLTPQKNLTLALDVLKRVLEKEPDTALSIVGAGSDLAQLQAYADTIDVGRNVVFEGWQNDMNSFYKTADVFLQTSLFEGYGMALVEAGLAGLPVVTTPVGIALELTQNEAMIVEQGKGTEMANAVLTLLRDARTRECVSVNLKQILEKKLFTKSQYIETLRNNWLAGSQKS